MRGSTCHPTGPRRRASHEPQAGCPASPRQRGDVQLHAGGSVGDTSDGHASTLSRAGRRRLRPGRFLARAANVGWRHAGERPGGRVRGGGHRVRTPRRRARRPHRPLRGCGPDRSSRRPGSTCRCARRWSAATSTTCPDGQADRGPRRRARPRLVGQEARRAGEHRPPAAGPRSCARRTPSSTTGWTGHGRERGAPRGRGLQRAGDRDPPAAQGGPPVITARRATSTPRSAAWRERRTARSRLARSRRGRAPAPRRALVVVPAGATADRRAGIARAGDMRHIRGPAGDGSLRP